MILLNSKSISDKAKTFLKNKQDIIDAKSTFKAKKKRAKTFWNSKKGSQEGAKVFSEIFEILKESTVGVETCNYCENNEAIDIEHLFPKSPFPDRAFIFSNYLLACKKCNTHYKLDRFSVFNPAGSTTIHKVKRGKEPPNSDGMFINLRKENPMDFLWLDIEGRTFRFVEISEDKNSREYKKAHYTITLLELNNRDALVAAREAAAKYYFSRLKLYIDVGRARRFNTLESILDPYTPIDRSEKLKDEKKRIRKSIKEDIINYTHATVWKELVRQRANLTRTNQLFEAANEALEW